MGRKLPDANVVDRFAFFSTTQGGPIKQVGKVKYLDVLSANRFLTDKHKKEGGWWCAVGLTKGRILKKGTRN